MIKKLHKIFDEENFNEELDEGLEEELYEEPDEELIDDLDEGLDKELDEEFDEELQEELNQKSREKLYSLKLYKPPCKELDEDPCVQPYKQLDEDPCVQPYEQSYEESYKELNEKADASSVTQKRCEINETHLYNPIMSQSWERGSSEDKDKMKGLTKKTKKIKTTSAVTERIMVTKMDVTKIVAIKFLDQGLPPHHKEKPAEWRGAVPEMKDNQFWYSLESRFSSVHGHAAALIDAGYCWHCNYW